MNATGNKIKCACAAAALLFAACTVDEETGTKSEASVVYPEFRIGVSDMTMNAETRAVEPMSPDVEKYVKTLAVFEFDNEGLHEKKADTYHFIDFVAGTVDGAAGVGDVKPTLYGIVETTLKGLSFVQYDKGTICLVANVSEAQVADFYDTTYRESGQSYGHMTFDKFKTWALPFEYEQAKTGIYDESVSGHIETMYMFGYYQGSIDPTNSEAIAIDLGRLASRLDITIVNETGEEIDKRFGYHFDNVCHSAYFFPIKASMPPTVGVGLSRTVICSGKDDPVDGDKDRTIPETFPADSTHTRYFYVAAHSAQNEEDATKLHLFYNSRIVDDDQIDDKNVQSVKIPLCNVHPSEAASVPNGYSLSRNTRYHFTIRLKKGPISPSEAKTTRAVEFGKLPGEIIVYLP